MLGGIYFTAERDAVSSEEALDDPYGPAMLLANRDLFRFPFMNDAIADPRFNNPDRMGRLVTFMARAITDGWVARENAIGMGVDQRTAIAIDRNGKARSTWVPGPGPAARRTNSTSMRDGSPPISSKTGSSSAAADDPLAQKTERVLEDRSK